MASYLDNYRKRVLLGTDNRREKLISQAERTFENQLKESPSAKRLKATLPGTIDILGNTNEIDCILLNITDNDIKSFDQKYLLVRKDENFDIGCYVEFDNAYWIAIFKEHRTLDTHKKFTLCKCNNIWRYKKHGVIYEIPIYTQNLSLYSDGLADNKYTSQEDGKVSIYYVENPITKAIEINTRVMIGNRLTFRITNINDYEFKSNHNGQCAIKSMLLQTTVVDKDDLENNIAWNNDNELQEVEEDILKIIGSNKAMLGSKKIYKCSKDIDNKTWEIECNEELKNTLTLKIDEEGNLEVRYPTSSRFVGESILLKLFSNDILQDTLEVVIKSI